MKYHTYPSLKSEADRQALWDGLLKGDLNAMATDEFCSTYSVKTQGRTINDITGGHNGTEARVGITYSVGVGDLGMSLRRFVDVTSANAAKIMGLYPRKGAIAPGSDADLVLIDPSIQRNLDLSDLHITDLQHLGGLADKGVAGDHGSPGQGGGGERPVLRRPGRRAAAVQKDRPRHTEPTGVLNKHGLLSRPAGEE